MKTGVSSLDKQNVDSWIKCKEIVLLKPQIFRYQQDKVFD